MNRSSFQKCLAGYARRSLLLLVAASARAGDGAANGLKAWPDTPGTRLEALALLQTLNADLLSNDSATLTLDRWCESHRMATPPKIVAERVHDRIRSQRTKSGSCSASGRRARALPPRATALRDARALRSGQLVRPGAPHGGYEQGARHE